MKNNKNIEADGSSVKNAALFEDLLRVGIAGVIFIGLALVMKHGGSHHYVATFRQWVEALTEKPPAGSSAAGIAVFILGSALLISLGIPRLGISAMAGIFYGAAWGTLWALAASALGAAGIYLMGRTLLSGTVERRIRGKMAIWKRRFLENAFWWVLYARMFPFANSTLTSLICGGCRVPFNPYMLASLAGFIPLTIVFAVFGSGGFRGSLFQIAFGFGILALTIGFRKMLAVRTGN